jgi:hypothetical protein
LTALVGISNGWSALLLAALILGGRYTGGPATLLGTGGAIWLTKCWPSRSCTGNSTAEAPVAGMPAAPDLAFAQTQNAELAAAGWRPEFVDYLFVAFTTDTSFGPTDVAVLIPPAEGRGDDPGGRWRSCWSCWWSPGRSTCSGEGSSWSTGQHDRLRVAKDSKRHTPTAAR